MLENLIEKISLQFNVFLQRLLSFGAPTKMDLAVQFAEKWQTLISGLLAVLAAGVTVYYLRRQINLEEERLEQERERARKGARIRVPGALSPISVYADKAFLYWVSGDLSKPFPTVPSEAVETLMQIAVDVDDDTFQSIRELALWLQVFEARAQGVVSGDERPTLNWRELFAHDVLRLKCLTDRLYAYGRGRALTLPFEEPDRATLEKAIPSLPILENDTASETTLRREIEAGLNSFHDAKNQ